MIDPFARRFPTRTSDPSTGVEGQCYYNSSTNKLRVFDGSAWADAVPSGGGGSISALGLLFGDGAGTVTGVKVYAALLTETGGDAPVATVLRNDLGGTVVWSYADVGTYFGTLSGAFPASKTIPLMGATEGAIPDTAKASRGTDNFVVVYTGDMNNGLADGRLSATPIIILVFP
jgi:hypothetical protein